LEKQKIQVNQLMHVRVDLPGYSGSYKTRLEEIDSTSLFLAFPVKMGQLVPLTKGHTVSVSFSSGGARYSFSADVLETTTSPIPMVVVSKPTQLNRVQRRNFVRFDTILPLKFSLIDGEGSAEKPEVFQAGTLDISGGGVGFNTALPLQMGIRLQLELGLPGQEPIEAIGTVVRVVDESGPVKKRYQIGVNFLVIEEKDRDRIIRHIFTKQRELRNKGLL